MIVYIVTSGEYSDFGIDAVLETREQAEAYCALHKMRNPYIDEWNTDDFSVKTDKPVLKKWLGHTNKDGSVNAIFDGYSFDSVFKVKTVTSIHTEPYEQIIFTTATSKSEEQAKKILLDKLAALKYEEEMGLEFK